MKKQNVDNLPTLPFYLYASVALLWLYSGIVPVLFAQAESLAMLAQLGIPERYQMTVFISASVLDVILGSSVMRPFLPDDIENMIGPDSLRLLNAGSVADNTAFSQLLNSASLGYQEFS